MATIDQTPRPAYIYDSTNSKWIEIAGRANTAADYTWSGDHTFSGTNGIVVQTKFNSFDTVAARASAIPNPQRGLLSYTVENNAYEFWNGTTWAPVVASGGTNVTLIQPTASPVNTTYTLTGSDAGSIIYIKNSDVAVTQFTLTVGTALQFVGKPLGTSITIHSNIPVSVTPSTSDVTLAFATSPFTLAPYTVATLILLSSQSGKQTWGILGSGPGVPQGGSTGQALLKVNNTDYNTTWGNVVTPSGTTTFNGGDVTFSLTDSTGKTNLVIGTGTTGSTKRRVWIKSTAPISGDGAAAGDIWISIP